MFILDKFFNRKKIPHTSVIFVEEEPEITDEIEKSLWELKETLDLPTEEIEKAVESRKNAIKN
jgi:hypothetical protein|tara:strand:- start:230 stop:418 length:189 start_codon:yes stop_codon:yes gene_type:complete